jgi:hypothetical protein
MKKNWYSITAKSDTECVVDIFDEIGMWGISAKEFAEQLRAVGKVKNLTTAPVETAMTASRFTMQSRPAARASR